MSHHLDHHLDRMQTRKELYELLQYQEYIEKDTAMSAIQG